MVLNPKVSASSKSFTMRLQNCSSNFNATSTVFSGIRDADKPSLLAQSPDSSAQEIVDASSNPLDITQTATTGRMEEKPSLMYPLHYKAMQIPVQPGTANGTLLPVKGMHLNIFNLWRASVFSALIFAMDASAADVTVNIKGSVQSASFDVNPSDTSKDVYLGRIVAQQFAEAGNQHSGKRRDRPYWLY